MSDTLIMKIVLSEENMKVVFIGAGSAFGSRVSVDILSREPLQDSTIALCDIDSSKLETVRKYVQKVIDGNNLSAKVITGTDRKELLKGADFVVLSVAIGGPAYYGEPFDSEMSIPARYGIRQTVADTMGPGAVFRALRSAAEMLDMIDDINRLAPEAVILNYTNPMAILTWVFNERFKGTVVGLCHGVQGNSKKLADLAGIPYEETRIVCAGINHMTWFTKFEHDGKDYLPLIHKKLVERTKGSDPYTFRGEIVEAFGYYPTESDRHFPEYVPWFQNGDRTLFEPHIAITMNVKNKRHSWFEDMGIKADSMDTIELIRSHEWASGIMEAMVTNVPAVFSGNVMNKDYITNLPNPSCVEIPCTADGNGIHPHYVGDIPIQCAALCKSNIIMQELMVHAILNKSKEAAYHALLMDPITQANLTIKKTKELFEEMWKKEKNLLSIYR
jgi:alpha-galactosidase